MPEHPLSRRTFLALSGTGVAALVVAACTPGGGAIVSTTTSMLAAESTTPSTVPPGGPVDVEIALRAFPDRVEIRPGSTTDVWRYAAEVIQGDPDTVEPIAGSYLGPTFRFQRGQRVRLVFDNEIPDESIVHWHGLDVPEDMDGHPRFAVPEGGRYVYEFTVDNRAGTYWYHPHPHGRTGPQVYAGMAGLILISDDEEDALTLPRGEFDIPLVIQDRTFNGDELVYLPNGMMDRMIGFLGDEILVNGHLNAEFPVATRSYRLRVLNGSNSRIYKLAWSDGTPLTILTTDGGLLETPVTRPYVTLGPAERVDLWADFASDEIGRTRTLVSLPFTAPQMGGMMGGTAALPLGAGFDVASFPIDSAADSSDPLPDRLSNPGFAAVDEAVNIDSPRVVTLAMAQGTWTLNGRTFQMTNVAEEEIVTHGTTEIWEFHNTGGGMGGGMMGGGMGGGLAHPMHMHGQQFQILDRSIDNDGRAAWETVSGGYVDDGWKDTVLVMPGEKVRVLRRFTTFPGLFLYHCHILEHEDMGMMRNFRIDTT
ncbi:MAG: multicopper oxidase domain-containing protein [Actinomycetia bacterium]|nr:multicopper oxidase domain-containing protein [Actinomycetes bacterium]